jgi:ubiquinol-cytochrome c reductase cytochrome b subunit
VRRLLKRAIDIFEERTGLIRMVGDLARHPVPPDTGWWYVFGSATLVAFAIQVATGMALATAYISSSGDAYQALQFISTRALFGSMLRGMHYFGASAMVLLVGIHMAQVFLMGCYKYPREFNWVSGTLLLFMTLAMGFTGQLLRWDQNAVWSIMVAANQAGRMPVVGAAIAHFMLAGDTLGGATLSRFFAFHVFFIPAIIFALVGLHLYLVVHDGISEPPVAGEPVDPANYHSKYEALIAERGVPFWPDAAWRDAVFCAIVIVAIVALGALIGAPKLGEPPNPSLLASDPRPDWYLVWYFALLALIPHAWTTAVIILAPLAALVILIVVPIASNRGERHPSRRPWAVVSVGVIVLMIGTLWYEGMKAPWSPDFAALPLPAHVIASRDGSILRGAALFRERGCEYCHAIAGFGGHRGPDLSDIADRLTRDDLVIRIMNGGYNMPSYASILRPVELDEIVMFLGTRRHIGDSAPADRRSMADHRHLMRVQKTLCHRAHVDVPGFVVRRLAPGHRDYR